MSAQKRERSAASRAVQRRWSTAPGAAAAACRRRAQLPSGVEHTPRGWRSSANLAGLQRASRESTEEVEARLGVSTVDGLSPAEAAHRLRIYGPNELHQEEPESLVSKFLAKFKE